MFSTPNRPRRTDTDIHINPASQEIYADFFNSMLGTDMGWEEIFAQTDRDINLQRVMNVVRYGTATRSYDWIPDRAIGPTDDLLYESEAAYNDGEVARILEKSIAEATAMGTTQKRTALMDYRKKELVRLIEVYYAERGWSRVAFPLSTLWKSWVCGIF